MNPTLRGPSDSGLSTLLTGQVEQPLDLGVANLSTN